MTQPIDTYTYNNKTLANIDDGSAGFPTNAIFNPSGTRLLTINSSTGGTFEQLVDWTLSSAFDLDTATLDSVLEIDDGSFALGDSDFGGDGCDWNNDGTKLIAWSGESSGVGSLRQYLLEWNLSTPYTLSTATVGNKHQFTNEVTSIRGIQFGDSGSKLFANNFDAQELRTVDLGTPYDVTTVGTITDIAWPSPFGVSEPLHAFWISPDGLKFYAGTNADITGNKRILEFSLGVAWDLSTLSDTGRSLDVSVSPHSALDSVPLSMWFKPDGSSMFISATNNSSSTDDLYEYTSSAACRLQAEFGFKSGGVARKVTDTVDGLHHLSVGDTCNNIVALVDGSVVDVQSCTGRVTLPRGAARAHFGLPYTTDIETPNIATGDGDEGQGKRKKVTDVTLRMYKSRSPLVGPNFFDMIPMKQRNEEPIGAPTTLLTGDLRVNIPPAWSSNGKISIRQKDPVPLTILAIIPEFDIEDDD